MASLNPAFLHCSTQLLRNWLFFYGFIYFIIPLCYLAFHCSNLPYHCSMSLFCFRTIRFYLKHRHSLFQVIISIDSIEIFSNQLKIFFQLTIFQGSLDFMSNFYPFDHASFISGMFSDFII